MLFHTFYISASTAVGDFSVYSATDRSLKIFVGDVYKLTVSLIGSFDAIWDNNATVAINIDDRIPYAKMLLSLLNHGGMILMASWEYNQDEHNRQPYSITSSIIEGLFQESFEIKQLECIDMTGTAFTKQFNLTYANKLIHLLTRKSFP